MEEYPANFVAANFNAFFTIHYSNFFRLKFPSKAMNAFLQPDKSWLIITLLINLYPAYICPLSLCHSVCLRAGGRGAGGVPQPCPNLFTWGPPSSSPSPSPKFSGGSKGGAWGTRPLLGVQILSISSSFWEILAKSYVGTPRGVGTPSSGKSWIRHWNCSNSFT